MNRFTQTLAAGALLAATPVVHALDWGVVLQEESEYTTNSARTTDDEVEEWVHQPGIQLQAVHNGPAVDLDVDYEIVREIYQQDVFDDENVAAGTADLVWRVMPERLDFLANHSRTQSTIRSIEVFTPDNREETVVTTAGPVLKFNPRGQDSIEFQYQWGDRASEDTEDDAITHEMTARYGWVFSPTNALTFEAIQRQVQYDNSIIPDLEYTIGQATWDRTTRNVVYSFQGGYTEVERTDLDDVDGFTFDISIDWEPLPGDQVEFNVAREIRDDPISLRSGRFGDELFFPVDSDLGEVFTNNRASLTWEKALNERTSFRFVAQYDEEDYEDALRDNERVGYTLNLTRELSRTLTLQVGVGYDERDYDDEGDGNDTVRANFDLTWQASPRLQLALGARTEDRESDTTGTGREYDESVGFVRISYALRQMPVRPAR